MPGSEHEYNANREILSLMGEGDLVYEVCPLCTTRGLRPAPSYTYLKNYGRQVEAFYGAFLLKNDENAFLVDTGITAAAYREKSPDRPCSTEPPIMDQLLSHGVTPEEIDAVILTHLHFDHAAQLGLFPGSRKIVQQSELDFARRDDAYLSYFYKKEYIEGVDFDPVSGDSGIADGICVLHLPGHTPGVQAVCIRTAEGICAISGFCVVQENFSPGPGGGRVIPAIHNDVDETWMSMKRLMKSVDYIYPNHSGAPVDVRGYQ